VYTAHTTKRKDLSPRRCVAVGHQHHEDGEEDQDLHAHQLPFHGSKAHDDDGCGVPEDQPHRPEATSCSSAVLPVCVPRVLTLATMQHSFVDNLH
jgi:hypothetical protein